MDLVFDTNLVAAQMIKKRLQNATSFAVNHRHLDSRLSLPQQRQGIVKSANRLPTSVPGD